MNRMSLAALLAAFVAIPAAAQASPAPDTVSEPAAVVATNDLDPVVVAGATKMVRDDCLRTARKQRKHGAVCLKTSVKAYAFEEVEALLRPQFAELARRIALDPQDSTP